MNREEIREIEARGENVDQAIANGLAQLGLSRDEVEIELLDEGSRGLLGLGARDAVVRLRPLRAPAAQPDRADKFTWNADDIVILRAPAAQSEPTAVTADVEPEPAASETAPAEPQTSPEEAEAERRAAQTVVETLLEKMQITATVTTRLSEPDDVTGRRINVIEIRGNDLGVLIGPRGDTLNAIQYLARLIVGHDLRQRITFIVDVEGYRQRRELALTRLAERMAGKVVKRQRPVSLEPMPPNERRIIHMALRHRDDVYTESYGEGKQRKVKIFPKE